MSTNYIICSPELPTLNYGSNKNVYVLEFQTIQYIARFNCQVLFISISKECFCLIIYNKINQMFINLNLNFLFILLPTWVEWMVASQSLNYCIIFSFINKHSYNIHYLNHKYILCHRKMIELYFLKDVYLLSVCGYKEYKLNFHLCVQWIIMIFNH